MAAQSANRGRKIAIIGGGIGGLTAALAFVRTGADVTVYEQAPAITEVGAGLQITPNGARVLDALGLAEVSDRMGIPAQAVEPMDALSGRMVTRFDLSNLDGPPYRFFHRADLIDLLAEACFSEGVAIKTGHRIENVSENGAFDVNGETQTPDLTVGADGLHSQMRSLLNGADDPFFTGQVAWRAIIDAPDHPPIARLWMAPGRHVVTYPLRGGRLNIVAVQERREWAADGWNHPADPSTLRNAFAGFSPRVLGLLNRVETVHEWGLFRHPVAPTWFGTRTAILGDAAHPTLPFMAQGANLAIEDAFVLAACCNRGPLDKSLPQYQQLRHARVERAIEAANKNAVNYHLTGARRRASFAVLKGIGAVAPKAWLNRLGWLYNHDVTTL